MKSNPRTLEYGGAISSLPVRVVVEMVYEQVRQGNKADYSVFEKSFWACKDEGGFDWGQSEKGADYWQDVVNMAPSSFPDDEIVDSLARIRLLTDQYISLSNKSQGTINLKGYGKIENFHTEEEKEMAKAELAQVKEKLLKLLK